MAQPANRATAFGEYPTAPKNAQCSFAYTILCNAHHASSSFFEAFTTVRKNRGAKGTPTDEEQDLLRACLVFAGAGLDSMAKQLLRDALRDVIDLRLGAQAMLRQHVSRHFLRDLGQSAIETLAEALVDPNPRARFVERLVLDLTGGSLQSVEELLRVGSYFDIPSADLLKDRSKLQEVFAARNQIVHEMDVDFAQPNRNRRPRSKSAVESSTRSVLGVAGTLLGEVDNRLSSDGN